jgi:type IV secretory pathway TraG/TraD family ATPase VirD4
MVDGDKELRSVQGAGVMVAIIAVAGVAVLLTVGGLLAGRVSGVDLARRPHFIADGVLALVHARRPSLGWGVYTGPTWRYWTVTAIVFIGVATLAVLGRYLWRRTTRDSRDDVLNAEGLAGRAEVMRVSGPKALVARSAVLRPGLETPTPLELGFRLGTARGVECYSSVEDSMVILGPPRSGKGYNLVIPMILDACGPVITTSTRPDSLGPTIAHRAQVGPVGVFDPQGLAEGIPSSLRWSPVRGCKTPQTAAVRAKALCADAGRGVTEASFWQSQTEMVVRCLLHAAALGGRVPLDLYRWSLSAPSANEAVEILQNHHDAAPSWSRALDSVISADQRLRDGVWSMVSTVFAPLADPHVLAAVSPEPGDEFDPVTFLRRSGTLYLLSTASGASATAALASALVEDVVETARRIASASTGARLDPPLSLILDEAANYPLPSLPALMSEGGGTGITTVAVLQSRAQARDRWGHDTEQAIWDSAIAKVILGGSSNAADLRDVSNLIGDRDYRDVSLSHQAGGGRSVSESTRRRDILDPSMIRSIRQGHALLLLRSASPIMLELKPWTARKDVDELQTQRAANEEMIRAGSAKRWGTDA